MNQSQILNEALRLYDMGFGVHWIKQNSKAPVNPGWADGTREDWRQLVQDIRDGYGLGVRLGKASRFPDGSYLANIDVDIKSSDPKHREQALAAVKKLIGQVNYDTAPIVTTGYGLRVFFRTIEPLQSKRITASNDRCIVAMPGSPISKEQLKFRDQGAISEADLAAGKRVRPAWEIELMSAGKQVVLPPSIHPDTQKAYEWYSTVERYEDLPLINASFSAQAKEAQVAENPRVFVPVVIDYMDPRFTDAMTKIVFGEDVDDRSAAAFSLSLSMVKKGFSDDEILSVLTDKDTFIGECSYDHRKTTNRANAADWARDYCLAKARKEADPTAIFAGVEILPAGTLTDEQAEKQAKGLIKERPWLDRLKRSGKDGDGPIKPTLDNTLLIIENAVGPGVFKRDLFAQRDSYGAEAPWTGAAVGKMLTDDDAVAIKEWLARKWGMEPGVSTIYEAMTAISIRNAYHPVREQLRALPPWDGVERLNTWLAKYFGAEGPAEYLAQVFRKWLVASITRTFEPGAKFDWLPIFEGGQGIGKSTFGALLFGQPYFADWLPNLADKDAALGLLGRRCIEFGELDNLRRNEIATVNAFVTRQIDICRPPYGRKSVELPRGVVFYGTTNKDAYLVDETGARRFNPIKVGKLDFGALIRDREQLWAEALFIYDLMLEPSLYLDNGAAIAAVQIQQDKRVRDDSDIMVELIIDWLAKETNKPENERFDLFKFKIKSLFEAFGPLTRYPLEAKNTRLAGKALKTLNCSNWKSHGTMFWQFNLDTLGEYRECPFS